jgi:hypothetical protein
MSKTLKQFCKKYKPKNFQEHGGNEDLHGGSLITSVAVPPIFVFELLEFMYGEYVDHDADVMFIDNKSTWERYFKTPNGFLRVYDFKGGTSIGFSGKRSKRLDADANHFKDLIEKASLEFIKNKRKILSEIARENPLLNFTRTFAAVMNLMSEAEKKNSFLELTILSFAMIDAQLRFAIILKTQIDEGHKEYERKLVFQGGRNDYYNEGYISYRAFKKSIISQKDYKLIDKLYELRNQAVHRYFISDFEYFDLKKVLPEFKYLIEKIGNKLGQLERKQVKLGVGMTTKKHLELSDEQVRDIIRSESQRVDSSKSSAVIPKRKTMFEEDEW